MPDLGGADTDSDGEVYPARPGAPSMQLPTSQPAAPPYTPSSCKSRSLYGGKPFVADHIATIEAREKLRQEIAERTRRMIPDQFRECDRE